LLVTLPDFWTGRAYNPKIARFFATEPKLRLKLEEENETVPDQKGKPTKRPTMRWIFFKFQGITELSTKNEEEIESEILNMEEVNWKILSLMGNEYENIYL